MFSEFITEKGVRALAIVFSVPVHTIYTWRRRGWIPRNRWDRLIEVYGLSYRRLVAMEEASRSTADA